MLRIFRIILFILLIAQVASAKKYDRIPDLDELVRNPIKGTYILVCAREQAWAEAGGYQVVSTGGSGITLTGFNSLKLILMVQPLRDWDKIATTLLVHLCIEEDTTYTIVSDRIEPIPRDTDPDKILGAVIGGPRSFIPQKTR